MPSSDFHRLGPNAGPRKAFTLIELLIVVAIIAILAAIAVPNFLEAQVRSKVSRALNDLRTMRTAIEAYAVDNNKYPRSTWGCPPYNDKIDGEPTWGSLPAVITSPISYITKLPRDPFAANTVLCFNEELYNYDSIMSMRMMLSQTLPTCPYPCDPSLIYVPPNMNTLESIEFYFGEYYLWCIGPAGPNPDPGGGNAAFYFLQYDATNGTVSRGRIFVTQKFTAPKYVPPNAFGF